LVWDTTITQINAPMEVDIITQNLDCTTNSVGNIQTRVSCGQPPFQYRWSTGETTPNLSNISAGDYTLTITDANNDQSIQTITLSGPTAMQLNDAIVAYQNCSGIISLDITGGIPNSFIYEWRDATNQLISTAAIPTELIGGTYSVTVTDANNCSLSAGPFAVESVSPIELVESKVDFSAPSALGTVRVNTILGGTPPYSFTWTDLEGDIIGTDSILRGVPIGAYIVRVSDANGCEQTTDQLVTSTIDIAVLESLTVYPNPTNGTTLLDASFLEAVDVELELLDGMGQVVWRRSLSSVWELRTPISFVDLPTGVFFLKIRIGEYAAFGRRLIYLR